MHKTMVVVGGAGIPESQDQRRKFGTTTAQIRLLREWLKQCGVVEAAMECTALDWRPVWLGLEGSLRLHPAQARSNPAPRDPQAAKRLRLRHTRALRKLGFAVTLTPWTAQPESPA